MIPTTVFAAAQSSVDAVRDMGGLVDVLGVVNSISRVEDYMILVCRDKKNFYVTVAQFETPSGRRIADMQSALLKTERLQAA